VGEILVEVEHETAVEDVRKACERALPFSFEFKLGNFIKRKPTLTDYGKYGFRSRTDEKINLDDERMLGLMDPHAKAGDSISIIGTEEEK
jgi:methyl-coenzyme M reductase subunit D